MQTVFVDQIIPIQYCDYKKTEVSAMVRRFAEIALMVLLGLTVFVNGQSHPGPKPAEAIPTTGDYSKQAIVVEKLRNVARFESDGRETRQVTTRIRVQSEAGVLQLGLLSFGYNTAFEHMRIEYLRVIKPDGTTVNASADSIQDLPAEIQRIAPQYSDFRQKNVNVPGLRPGDILEYSVTTETFAPIVPGQFSATYSFNRSTIVLNEEIELNLPSDRKVAVKSKPESQPFLREESGRKIYTWTHSNRSMPESMPDAEEQEPKTADIQVSTFQDWSEVARWYASLQRPKVTISETIKSKATELTAGLNTDDERIAALYNYVATNIRYVSISLGIGRFQPHDAAEVLHNQYGDCKDKHTLLAAMLASMGINSEPVLINAETKIDSEVPSPFQFNHLVSAIKRGDSYLYADTTTEVAPLGYLVETLRNKQALLVGDSTSRLITTPAKLPVDNFERIDVAARIDTAGTLQADLTITARGDAELLWRGIMRRVPESQWPQLLKFTMSQVGLESEVSDITATSLADTRKPLELRLHLTKKEYVDWPARVKTLTLPIPNFGLRPAATPEQKKGPIKQQEHYALERRLRLEVPVGVKLYLPVSSSRKEDFAEFEAKYNFEGNRVLQAERVYRMNLAEIPRSRYKDFNRLYDDVGSDEDQKASFELSETFAAAAEHQKALQTPHTSKTAEELFVEANKALSSAKYEEARDLLEKVTQRDPKNADAWVLLGALYFQSRAVEKNSADKAIGAYRTALSINPRHQNAWMQIALAMSALGRYSDAAEAIRKQLEITPLQKGLNGVLAYNLMSAHRPADAIPVLEKAAVESPGESYYPVSLARAYLQTGDQDRAMLILSALIKSKPGALTRSHAAEMLAEENSSLDWAEQQVQEALSSAYESLQKANTEFMSDSDVQRAWKLAEIWSVTGWIYFRRGEMAKAHKYLEAGWAWSQSLVHGDRLAQLYLQEGKRDDALRIWAQALPTAIVEHPEIKQRFQRAVGDREAAEQMIRSHRLELQEMRTVAIPNPGKISGSAEIYVLIGPGPEIEAMNVFDGDEKLRTFLPELKAAKIPLSFPDNRPIHVVRSAVFSCTNLTPKCAFVFKPSPPVMRYRSDDF